MPQTQFDDEQCNIFIRDSKTHYDKSEISNTEIIRWKFMGFQSHPSYHLSIPNSDKQSNSGRAVLNSRTLNFQGHYKKITQVTDLLSVKSKASLMTFIELIKQYRSLNTDGVFHTSNENSEKIYSNFFKFKEIFELSAFAFPIQPQKLITFFKKYPFLSKIIDIYSLVLFVLMRFIKSVNPISLTDVVTPDQVNIHLKGFTSREVSFLRSEEFFTWRYLNAPYAYKSYVVYFRKKPIGILAARLTQFQGAYFFLVMDYISSAQIGAWEGFGLRLALISEAIAQNADAIFGLFNRKNRDLATFFQPPFVAVNDKMLPHRSPVFVSSLAPTLKAEELERMYFSLGDLDYF